ncbi:MAG TPA: hypothetical protein EYP49_17075 [Anaerolineae bacterium]|nr:hypothetical protein [Anaerolineae bacterium]
MEGYYLKDPTVATSRQRLYQKEPNPLQIETYRAWDNARKMRSMFEMFELAMHRARMGVRARHSDWDDKQVEARARELATHRPLIREDL